MNSAPVAVSTKKAEGRRPKKAGWASYQNPTAELVRRRSSAASNTLSPAL